MPIEQKTAWCRVLACAMCALAAPLSAASTPGEGAGATSPRVIEEITVTAQRRAEPMQGVPLAVSAFDARMLAEAGLTDVNDLAAHVPNLQISTLWGSSSPKIFMRGVGNNSFNQTAESKVALYLDQVYMSAPSGQLFQMFDLERVEVLRGPQGTLYGKNSTGGAIAVASRLPASEFEGSARLSAGNFDSIDAEVAVSLPITEDLAARLAFSSKKRDGTVRDAGSGKRVNDVDRWAARGVFLFTPTDNQEYILNVHGGKSDSTHNNSVHRGLFDPNDLALGVITRLSPDEVKAGAGVDLLGHQDPNPDPYTNTYGTDTFANIDLFGTSLIMNIELAGGYTLTSVTGYERSERHVLQDGNGAPSTIFTIDWGPSDFKQISQELRVASPSHHRLGWVAGAFYFNEEATVNNFYNLADVAVFLGVDAFDQHYDQDTEGYAVFGQATYSLTDTLGLTVGARYTYEKRELDHITYLANADRSQIAPLVVADLEDSWKEWSGRIALDYTPKDDVMLFASINRGFTAGGFNTGAFNDPVGAQRIFDPEALLSYEIGAKTFLLDRRVRFNATAFYYDYSDLQVFVFTQDGLQFIENASDAKVMGLELELQALLFDGLELTASLGITDAEYKNFVRGDQDLSGNRLIGSPKVQFHTLAQYTIPVSYGSFVLRGDFSYSGKRYYDETQAEDISSEGSDTNLDLRVAFLSTSEALEIALWGRNVTNEKTIIDIVDVGVFGYQNVWYNTPRTYGLEIAYRF